jgi:hypothetical protein
MLASAAIPVGAALVLLTYTKPEPHDVRFWFMGLFVSSALLSLALLLSWLLPVADDS